MMKMEKMFSPLKIGSCELKNRFVVTAMVCDMCDENGYATERYVKYHEAKAKGGYGLIITEDYAVNANAGGYRRVARIYKEDMIEGHRKLTEAVHKYGTKIFCQIYHAGRQSNSKVNGGMQPVAPSVTSCPWNREQTKELTIEEIHQIVKDFGNTAINAKKAGFDGIEIHAGNGYLIAGFLSLLQNKRTDMYGGCFENRIRILKEIYDEVRSAVGSDFPIQVRFSAEEHERDGRTIAESRMLAQLIEEWGFDAINCSNGLYGTYNLQQVSTAFMPKAWTAGNAGELKKIVHIPVMAVNSIVDPLMAESLVEMGMCDYVGMSRCSLADPEMPNKAREGRFDEIRPCVRCLQGCTAGTLLQIPIRCCVNPEMGNEYKYTFEDVVEKKKVLVVGGGPGGIWAAIAAARRGHDVTIWDKNKRLGGELLAAMYPPTKGEFATYIAALTKTVERLGVKVELQKEASAEDVKNFAADKTIIATGGLPNVPGIPGIDRDNVVTARDVLLGNRQIQGRIIVAGGGEVGVETAMYLAQLERGAITIVEMLGGLAEKTDPARVVQMKQMLVEREIQTMLSTKVIEIQDDVMVVEKDGVRIKLPYDAIVVSMGYHPNNKLAEELKSSMDNIIVIGDATQCTNAMEAATQGFDAGYYA